MDSPKAGEMRTGYAMAIPKSRGTRHSYSTQQTVDGKKLLPLPRPRGALPLSLAAFLRHRQAWRDHLAAQDARRRRGAVLLLQPRLQLHNFVADPLSPFEIE